jgi:hypothetical protein
VVAELLRTAEGRLYPDQELLADRYVKGRQRPRVLPSADLIAALTCWGMGHGLLTAGQIEAKVRKTGPWWARAEIVSALDQAVLGATIREGLLNARLKDKVSDVAIAAAVQIALGAYRITVPPASMQTTALRVLEAFGLVPTGTPGVCGIERSFRKLLGSKAPVVNWRTVFGSLHSQVERHAVWSSGHAGTNVTAWVNAMDVFNDFLLDALYKHDPTIGIYKFGTVGSVVGNTGTRLERKYPAVFAMVKGIHEKRWEGSLSHAWSRKGSKLIKPTRPIPYRFRFKAIKWIDAGLRELAIKW